jgi:hypothetical protein
MTIADWTGLLPAGEALAWLLVASFAAGLARGFSGFGQALIFVPVATMAMSPQVAAPLMWALEAYAIVKLTPTAWQQGERAEAGWLTLGVLLGTPLGALALVSFNVLALRWMVALSILAMLGLLVSGWRFRGPRRPALSAGVGAVGGLFSGIAMAPGPPVMTYLLGRDGDARQARATFALFLATNWVVVAVAFAVAGLLDRALLVPLAATAPAYAAGIWGGQRMFGLADEKVFRRACYAMIGLAAIIGMPVWGGALR